MPENMRDLFLLSFLRLEADNPTIERKKEVTAHHDIEIFDTK